MTRLGALGATVVAVVFALVGDGVPNGTVDGWEGGVIDHAHTAVWVCLATGLWLTASPQLSRRRWGTPLLLLALGLYVAFQIVVHRRL